MTDLLLMYRLFVLKFEKAINALFVSRKVNLEGVTL